MTKRDSSGVAASPLYKNVMSPRSHLISVKSTRVVSNLIEAPFLEILQMSDGRILDTNGSQLVKSHFRSTTKSPSFFNEAIISGFLCRSCSLDWC
jgi:hypothetical protein